LPVSNRVEPWQSNRVEPWHQKGIVIKNGRKVVR